jgi:GNAT superfamily N-acetyltransferase
MIRDRREPDIDRLVGILRTKGHPSRDLSDEQLAEWLSASDTEKSWVFDMAPVRVTPTRNVVAHVQVYRPCADFSSGQLDESAKVAPSQALVIGKLFVRPDTHERGIGRYLLKESVTYVRGRGKLPVLDVHTNAFASDGLYEKLGFEAVPSATPGVTVMIHSDR